MTRPKPHHAKNTLLGRTAPSRQKQAEAYLKGQVPGVMEHYAPDARPDPDEGWVESDETVHRLAHWREDAIY